MPASFSKVKYEEVAPYVGLEVIRHGSDIREMKIFRSRLPIDLFRSIVEDVDLATLQYGRMSVQHNEESRSRYIASVSYL